MVICVVVCLIVCMHTHMHTCTYTHTHSHTTYIHTHNHTHTLLLLLTHTHAVGAAFEEGSSTGQCVPDDVWADIAECVADNGETGSLSGFAVGPGEGVKCVVWCIVWCSM
jgi:predicted cupin superfamily sugar epimerase